MVRQLDWYKTKTLRENVMGVEYAIAEYTWVIDQACLVKMAGYWQSSLHRCIWTETEWEKLEHYFLFGLIRLYSLGGLLSFF